MSSNLNIRNRDTYSGPDRRRTSTDRLATVDDLARFLRVSRSKAYQVVSAEDFPKPLRISGRIRRWSWAQILEWVGEV